MVRAALILALFLAMAPAILGSPAVSLQVRAESGAVIWCASIRKNATMDLQFTHSMYGGYVRETWRITPDSQLMRTRFVTENAAAAEYYATDGTSYRDSEGFVVPGELPKQSKLVVRVNDRGNHVLRVGGQTVHLAGEVSQSTQVHISVISQPCQREN